ncbi:hypothetical protein PQX77_019760 [Marasmius sp. AFHP31]|nr:hypothetical protein PQX77_019760 [Marasmius sp. AFHP31]
MKNFGFVLTRLFLLTNQKQILLFFDRISLLLKVLRHLCGLLPDNLPVEKKKIVRFYDSCMSAEFLAEAHEDFTTPGGPCRVLLLTTSESTGIDFLDVDIVVNVDIPLTAADAGQRRGRALRKLSKHGLFLILYEPWVRSLLLEEFEENQATFNDDPDRPRAKLDEKSNVRDCAAYSMAWLLNDDTLCIRKFFKDYLEDESPSALDYHGPFCCDRHNNGFNLNNFLPSPVYKPSFNRPEGQSTEASSEDDNEAEGTSTQRKKYRTPISV